MDTEALPFKERALERLVKLIAAVREWSTTIGPAGERAGKLPKPITNVDRLNAALRRAGGMKPLAWWFEFVGKSGVATRLEQTYDNLRQFCQEADEAFRMRENDGVAGVLKSPHNYYEYFAPYRAEEFAYYLEVLAHFLRGEESAAQEPTPPSQEARTTPLSKAEIARRLFRDPDARWRKAEPILRNHGVRRAAQGKNLWTVRLDTLDTETSKKLLAPLSTTEQRSR